MSNMIPRKKLLLCIFTFAILSLIPAQSFAEEQIPDWVKNTFVWFADGIITETDVLNAIKFLVENEIIVLDVATKASNVSNLIQSENTKSIDIPVTTHDKVDYTVLVYVVGSDLESKWNLATADFKEMIQGNPNDSVNVIVQTGGAKATPGGDRTIDFTKVKIHEVSGSGFTELHDLGKKNMGVPSTLSDFLVWGTQSYPAEKFVLILWNHGSGINGYGNDEVTRDILTLDELDDAMSNAKQRNDVTYEIVGFDACLMATLEVANIMKSYSNYMVASEEFEVGYGWKYDKIISSLNNNSKQSGADLGKVIADSFFADTKAISQPGQDFSRITTLSVVDLSKISSLNDSLNSLTSQIESKIAESDIPKFSVSLGDSERYGIVKGKDSGHMDIKHFSKMITEHLPQFKTESDLVKSNVDSAIVYKINGKSKPNANGLSIYMPRTSEVVSTSYKYGDVSSTNTFYSEYLDNDKTAPAQNLQFDGKIITGTYSNDDVYEINVIWTSTIPSDDEYGLVDILAVREFKPDAPDSGFIDGNVNFSWDGHMPKICNNDRCLSVSPEWEWGDDLIMAYIPAILNRDGDEIEVNLLFDTSVKGDEVLIGAYPHSTEDVFDKNLLSPQSGDVVYSIYEMNLWGTDQSLYFVNTDDPIPVDDGFGFQWAWDADILYMIVEICDYSSNCSYSDWFQYDNRGPDYIEDDDEYDDEYDDEDDDE